jgi:hypothetical protein
MKYCQTFFDNILQESLPSAKVVVPFVLDLLKPESVVDVGCATGAWLSVFRDSGIKSVLGLDGSYVDRSQLLIPLECFSAIDLAEPFGLSRRFDLALSLEVAEHLPASRAEGFVKSLCKLSPIVLFSAAIPGQGGDYHINEQWPEYWRQLFAREHFRMLDPFRPVLWHDERVASYYRQNLFLFVHDTRLRDHSRLSQLPEVKNNEGLMLVEPNILLGLQATLRRLPLLVVTAIRRRIQRVTRKNGCDRVTPHQTPAAR